MNIYILSYPGLEPDQEVLQEISNIHGQSKDTITVEFESINYQLFDIVYITRLQRERLLIGESSLCNFMMTNQIADRMKEDAIIMHPLPRNEEIHSEVDQNHRCHYFKQMKYGVNIRMALISEILSIKN